MATLKKYTLEGKEVGEVGVDDNIVAAEANGQMIKDYITALRANARQWSANTLGRSEVKHTTRKPHRQKGTGRARQGSTVSPQYRGGGIVFGPKPKFDQHVRINKKERRAAIRYLLAEKVKFNKVRVLDNTELDPPKTKTVQNFLDTCELRGRRVLFLGEGNFAEVETHGAKNKVSVRCDKHANFAKSTRNIPKVQFALVGTVSGYDIIAAQHIVLTEAALTELQEWLS